jgi:hypothetical protein
MEKTMKKDVESNWLSESEVYKQYGKLLKDRELRLARQKRQIEYIPSGRGFFYRQAWVEDYLESKKVAKCAQTQRTLRAALPEEPEESGKSDACSNSKGSGSSKKPTELSLVHGMTPELEGRVAEALAPQTSRKQKPS